jgi:hypothetical protein
LERNEAKVLTSDAARSVCVSFAFSFFNLIINRSTDHPPSTRTDHYSHFCCPPAFVLESILLDRFTKREEQLHWLRNGPRPKEEKVAGYRCCRTTDDDRKITLK